MLSLLITATVAVFDFPGSMRCFLVLQNALLYYQIFWNAVTSILLHLSAFFFYLLYSASVTFYKKISGLSPRFLDDYRYFVAKSWV